MEESLCLEQFEIEHVPTRLRAMWNQQGPVFSSRFLGICEMVAPDLEHGRHTTDLPVADQVAIAIHILGRNVMQSDSARLAGCHQSTVSRVLMAFVNAINRRATQFMNWPDEQEA
ncbi:unnamed protein product [Haemonchus placei]|uniref:HTH_Tnp_4 domain-containing protein n=1 Tax=Haemonchus placei TaxID=6290 RepID=A0A0N4X3I3_HAEPC|nr:unnamed protein product [Haemonchus placei]